MECCGAFDPEVVRFVKNDNNIRSCRADWYFRNFVNGRNIVKRKSRWRCDKHQDCSNYSIWKKRHPSRATLLKKKVKRLQKCVYEHLDRSIMVNNKKTRIKGTIRSLIPKCQKKAKSYGVHPHICNNCHAQHKYLKMKLKKRSAAVYSRGYRYGKRGVRKDYLTQDELCGGANDEVAKRKGMEKDHKKFVKQSKATQIENQLFTSCVEGDDEKFLYDLHQLIEDKRLTADDIHLEIIKNLTAKLQQKRRHHYSELVLNVSRLTRNLLGRANYQAIAVCIMFLIGFILYSTTNFFPQALSMLTT